MRIPNGTKIADSAKNIDEVEIYSDFHDDDGDPFIHLPEVNAKVYMVRKFPAYLFLPKHFLGFHPTYFCSELLRLCPQIVICPMGYAEINATQRPMYLITAPLTRSSEFLTWNSKFRRIAYFDSEQIIH